MDAEMPGARGDKMPNATSSASLYDNVNNSNAGGGGPGAVGGGAGPKVLKSQDSITRKDKQQQNETCQTAPKTANVAIGTTTIGPPQVRRRSLFLDLLSTREGIFGVGSCYLCILDFLD